MSSVMENSSFLIGYPHWLVRKLYHEGPQFIPDILDAFPKFKLDDLVVLTKFFIHICLDFEEMKISLDKPKDLDQYGVLVGLFLKKSGPMDISSIQQLFPSSNFCPYMLPKKYSNFGFDATSNLVFIRSRASISEHAKLPDSNDSLKGRNVFDIRGDTDQIWKQGLINISRLRVEVGVHLSIKPIANLI
jgi:hypothetical protein